MSTSTPNVESEVDRLLRLGRDREAADLAAVRTGRTGGDGTQCGMDPASQIDQVLPLINGVAGGLGPEDLAKPTPCANFTLGQILEHMVGGATLFAAAFRGEQPGPAPADDLVAALPVALEDLRQAVHSPGALERPVEAPFGTVPGDVFARFVALDGLVHGWDIATATGQPYDPPAELVAEIDAFARQAIGPEMRDGDTFADETEPPADASPVERVVAFTGRTVPRP